MSDRLRVGIIGMGILGREYAAFLGRHPAVQIVAASDVRPGAASPAALPGAELFTDTREMLRRCALDVAVVATPDHLHRDPTLAAVAAGVPHIIQEKPLATTIADAEVIAEAVERSGARLFVNYANRAAPLDIATRYVVQRGLIGDPVHGEVRLDDNIWVPTRMWGERGRSWGEGSSPAHFLLSHVVDLLRWYFAPAEVTDVFAVSQRRVLGFTPDLYDAFLTFDTGLTVRAKAEWVRRMDELVEFSLGFTGSAGGVTYHKIPGFGVQESWRANLTQSLAPEELLAHQRALRAQGAAVRAVVHRPALGGEDAGDAPALEHLGPSRRDGMALVAHIIDGILEGAAEPAGWRGNGPLPSHVDGLRQTAVVEALVESSRARQPRTVGI